MTTKTSKSSSVNSHKYNKSSISTISESGYSTDDTQSYRNHLLSKFYTHSFESPQLKMVDITEESNFDNENSNSTITTNTIMAKMNLKIIYFVVLAMVVSMSVVLAVVRNTTRINLTQISPTNKLKRIFILLPNNCFKNNKNIIINHHFISHH